MKFDCIIMNPPYQRNLHLKILAEAIKHLKDEKSVCVNLSPVRWLQDPLAKYKKHCDLKRFEKSIAKHIKDLEILSISNTNQVFGLDMGCLSIYVCDIYEHSYIKDWCNKHINTIADKIASSVAFGKYTSIASMIKFDDMPGICITTSPMVFAVRERDVRMKHGWLSQPKKLLFYTDKKNDMSGETYFEYRKRVSWGNNKPKAENFNIKFLSKKDRENFYNFWRLKIMRYFYDAIVKDVNVPSDFMPWLGDTTNPRTGLKGYEGEWTDEDLYQLFGLTDDEKKIIEETMEKHEAK